MSLAPTTKLDPRDSRGLSSGAARSLIDEVRHSDRKNSFGFEDAHPIAPIAV